MQTDTFWKIAKGHSVILQHYSDEIAQSKPKPAKTLVHATQWLPYGPRVAADSWARAAYALALRRMVSAGLVTQEGCSPKDLEVKLIMPKAGKLFM